MDSNCDTAFPTHEGGDAVKTTLLTAMLLLIPTALFAQHNCCLIANGSPQTGGTYVNVPPSDRGPGGSYYLTLAETIAVTCMNSSSGTAKVCSAGDSNMVKGNGTYGYYNCNFIPCSPRFAEKLTPSSVMGVYPKPIFDVTGASVANLVSQHHAALAYDRGPPPKLASKAAP